MSDPVVTLMNTFGQRAALRTEGKMADAEAAAVGQQTGAAENQFRRQSRELLSQQVAAIGESGIGYGGSSAEVMQQSAIDAELDALNIRYEGELRRQGLKQQAKLARRGSRAVTILGLTTAAVQAGEKVAEAFGMPGSGGPKEIDMSSLPKRR